MTTQLLVVATVAVFIVAAMLYYQAPEPFANPVGGSLSGGPVAGRWYNSADTSNHVPADLNHAPVAVPPSNQIPSAVQRPSGIPGPSTAPRDALASRKDLTELDSQITVWLAAAAQRDTEHPGSLSPSQLQEQVILQGRLAAIREELGTGMITDTYKTVSKEIAELRRQNASWGTSVTATMISVHGFAKHSDPDSFLTPEQFKEFRALLALLLKEFSGHQQPDPLERVRLKQLQVIDQELDRYRHEPPPIKVGTARLFLERALHPDQPLPSLFSHRPDHKPDHKPGHKPGHKPDHKPNHDSPAEILRYLKDIQWKLTISYNPAEQELMQAIAAMMKRIESEDVCFEDMETARKTIDTFKNHHGPSPAPSADDRNRAMILCKQIHEAFPGDEEAMGCPRGTIETNEEATNVIQEVCDRIRYSVPTVTPEQFNCPAK
jgi:hypothetical protein